MDAEGGLPICRYLGRLIEWSSGRGPAATLSLESIIIRDSTTQIKRC